jgi:hypothetical protein
LAAAEKKKSFVSKKKKFFGKQFYLLLCFFEAWWDAQLKLYRQFKSELFQLLESLVFAKKKIIFSNEKILILFIGQT